MTSNKRHRVTRFPYNAGLIISLLLILLTFQAGGATAKGLAQAATAPGLGVAGSFAVLGASTVTNTGSSVINGDLGVAPGSAVTGFPPGIVTGTIHGADEVTQNAQDDATIAFGSLAGQSCHNNLTGQDLGGKTLTPGVYCFDSSAQLTGTLTLDAQGNEYSVFIFQIGSALTTGSSASVNIINADKLCNVFWKVGSSATLGTTTAFVGTIIADQSITLNNGATLSGRALALNAAVTLDNNVINIPVCAVQPTPDPTTVPTQPTVGPTQPTTVPTGGPTQPITATITPVPGPLPGTGGDLTGPQTSGTEVLQLSLGLLGAGLLLFGIFLIRNKRIF